MNFQFQLHVQLAALVQIGFALSKMVLLLLELTAACGSMLPTVLSHLKIDIDNLIPIPLTFMLQIRGLQQWPTG